MFSGGSAVPIIHRYICALFAVFLILPGQAQAQTGSDGASYTTGAIPDWVIPIEAPTTYDIPVDQIDDGAYDLLVDRQTRIGDQERSHFQRFVYQVINEVGVEQKSDISISFDPSYESITLHHVKIRRGKETVDQLIPENIRVLYQERDLKKLMYSGDLTLHLLLEGVRRGDIIDYSFTRSGANPALKGKFFSGFDASWGVPVLKHGYRLLWPKDRKLHYRLFNMDQEPVITKTGDLVDYRWSFTNTAPTLTADDAPSWHYPWAWVQFSEVATWQEVADLESDIFNKAFDIPVELQTVIDNIRDRHASPSDRMIAALRFVQDEIRYVAINLGTGGLIPNAPHKTLKRRYGDCKDKTVLLTTMLHELGITAYPALVDTVYRDRLANFLPSQTIFDHILVKAELDGQVYWLDGTLTNQRGDLERLTQPDFGKALVLQDGTTGLVDMDVSIPKRPSREIEKEFDLSAGPNNPGTLMVTKIYRDAVANNFREYLRANGMQIVADNQLRYYGDDYRGATYIDRPEIVQNDHTNEITLKLRFNIPEPWYFNDGEKIWHADVFAWEVRQHLGTPADINRNSPFSLEYPTKVRMKVTVNLPGQWDGWLDGEKIENDYFTFKKSDLNIANTIHETYDFNILADHVDLDGMGAFRGDMERARALTGSYKLNYAPQDQKS